MAQVRRPCTASKRQHGRIIEVPATPHPNVLIVVAVVVDVEAARGKAANNDGRKMYVSVPLQSPELKASIRPCKLLYFIWRPEYLLLLSRHRHEVLS